MKIENLEFRQTKRIFVRNTGQMVAVKKDVFVPDATEPKNQSKNQENNKTDFAKVITSLPFRVPDFRIL